MMNYFKILLMLSILPTIQAQNDWSQIGYDIDGDSRGETSGQSVALSADGTTVAVGAHNAGYSGVYGTFGATGHVRVFRLSGNHWSQIGSNIYGDGPYDWSGISVAISSDGNIVAVGAYGNGAASGNVRVFRLIENHWTKIGSNINGEAPNDKSGIAVDLSNDGNTVAVGAPGNGGNGYKSGHVRVFRLSGNHWSQIGSDIDGDAPNDYSGHSVALSADGHTVAIGAEGNDGNGADSGHVRVFRLSGNHWSQIGSDIDGEATHDYSGSSVALSADGNIVAVGAHSNDGNGDKSGHVRVFRFSGNHWSQIGTDIDGEAPHDHSGHYNNVVLSADGNIVAVGARYNDGNGKASGHVRVFRFSGNDWSLIGSDIDGEALHDASGTAVALSADGHTVAIGAGGNDGNGAASGHVRVYKLVSELFTFDGDCDIEGDCISSKNFPGVYGNRESCLITMTKDASVSVRSTFSLEKCCDHLNIRKVDVDSIKVIPKSLNSGETIMWSTDYSDTYKGWQICFFASIYFTMTGDCDVAGDCVSSSNHPTTHGHNEQCTVTMIQDASVTVGSTFSLEICCDHLMIRGNDVESPNAVPLTFNRGERFSWSSDSTVSKPGWQLCFSPYVAPP